MTEKLIAEGIQDILQGMTNFADPDVTICDWSILDGPIAAAPFAVIEVSDEFDARQDAASEVTTWEIPVTILERFIDWRTSLTAFRDTRQAIIDEFNEDGTNRSAGGISGYMVNITSIRAGTPIAYRYQTYTEAQNRDEQTPTFIQQQLIFEVEQESNA